MQIKKLIFPRSARSRSAFSLVEVTIGMGIIGTVIVGLFSGFSCGFFTMRMARENLRATQIMLEKVETIRLYSWDQINTPGFIPATFQATYDPQSTNAQGLTYSGTMTITDAPISSSYSNDMKLVTVSVNWKTGGLDRNREFSTYVSRYGLQNYIY